MKIKIVAIDLDGTLLNSKKEISKETKAVLKECMEKGIHIVPATGRTVDGIPECLKEMTGIRYVIATNGAFVADLVKQKTIASKTLPNQLALDLLQQISGYHAMYDPYIEGRGKLQPEFMENLEHYGLPKEIRGLVEKTRDLVPDVFEFVKQSGKPVEKINMFFGDMEEREKVRAVLEQRTDIIVTSSLYNNLEINSTDATKGNGLKLLADYLHTPIDQVMAIGDGNNDISMLVEAGIGVAMENAPAEVKDAADYITLNNDENGVAEAIRHFAAGLGE